MKQLHLAAEGATLENFREKAYKYASSVMKLSGGPWQYLQKAFPPAEAKAEFAQYLRATYPSRYDLEYCHGPAQLPKDDTVRFCLSPADLSFEAGSSTKPPPQRHTALSLLDEILTRGFVTQGRPQFLHYALIVACSGCLCSSSGLCFNPNPWHHVMRFCFGSPSSRTRRTWTRGTRTSGPVTSRVPVAAGHCCIYLRLCVRLDGSLLCSTQRCTRQSVWRMRAVTPASGLLLKSLDQVTIIRNPSVPFSLCY